MIVEKLLSEKVRRGDIVWLLNSKFLLSENNHMGKEEAKRKGRQSKKSGGRVEQQASGSPLSSRLATEKVMLDVHRVMQGREFQTIEEANAFLATLAGPGLKEALKEAPTPSPQQEAQEIAYRAMEAPTRTRALALAQQALAKDPHCVDALVTLAAAGARSVEDLIAGLEKAVAAGERSLGAKYFEENKGHFWGILETRPYMRARQQLADLLLDAGRVTEAINHFEGLLELNPNDNQGVRDILLGCYLVVDDLYGARHRLRAYEEDVPSSTGDERWSTFYLGTLKALSTPLNTRATTTASSNSTLLARRSRRERCRTLTASEARKKP